MPSAIKLFKFIYALSLLGFAVTLGTRLLWLQVLIARAAELRLLLVPLIIACAAPVALYGVWALFYRGALRGLESGSRAGLPRMALLMWMALALEITLFVSDAVLVRIGQQPGTSALDPYLGLVFPRTQGLGTLLLAALLHFFSPTSFPEKRPGFDELRLVQDNSPE